mmetsp:Transcript_121597/g.192479  ORF Transcript_121597/g.192479 Transcript_121597/m.192479 type:complete len:591 (-) Transcript_121597:208-1980(-)
MPKSFLHLGPTLYFGISCISFAVEYPAWVVGPFGACRRDIDTRRKGILERAVQCVSVLTREILDNSACDSAVEPCATISCSCNRYKCTTNSSISVAAQSNCLKKPPTSLRKNPPIESIGYISVDSAFGELDEELFAEDPTLPATCLAACGNDGTLCHRGFSFFRKGFNSGLECAAWCIFYGLDVAAWESASTICRCGATPANKAVLGDSNRSCVMFNRSVEAQPPAGRSAQVRRYIGYYMDGGIPIQLTKNANELQIRYIDSIVAGQAIQINPVDETVDSDIDVTVVHQGAGWLRRCFPYPNKCAAVGPRETMRVTISSDMPDFDEDEVPPYRFNKYLNIRYMFLADVDDYRKEAFREAAAAWQYATCISFSESGELGTRSSYDLEVRQTTDDGSCSATLGMPSLHAGVSPFSGYINLGWCNDMRYVGNMMHEIGHVLGLNHEQTRPDGSEAYYGKGPHLHLKWENIASDWHSQWKGIGNAYTGSGSDESGDIVSDYAPYDFNSIMHYTVSATEGTTEPVGQATGNRQYLSDGDVKQILDMYQCYLIEGTLPKRDPGNDSNPNTGTIGYCVRGLPNIVAILFALIILSLK